MKWHDPTLAAKVARAGRASKDAIAKKFGIPRRGGRPPKPKTLVSQMTKMLVSADAMVEAMPVINKPDSAKTPSELLQEAARAGLVLQRDTVRLVQGELEAAGKDVDVPLLRAGLDAAAQLGRLMVRAAEGEFRARKDDAITRLLEQIAEERGPKL